MSNMEILFKVFVTYSNTCVAANHEKSDSYDDVVKSKYQTFWGKWGKRNRH